MNPIAEVFCRASRGRRQGGVRCGSVAALIDAGGYASIPIEQVLSERWLRAEPTVVIQVVPTSCHFGQKDNFLMQFEKATFLNSLARKVYLVREVTKWAGNADE